MAQSNFWVRAELDLFTGGSRKDGGIDQNQGLRHFVSVQSTRRALGNSFILVIVSVGVTRRREQKQLEEEKVYFSLQLVVHHPGKSSGRNLEAGPQTQAETMEG